MFTTGLIVFASLIIVFFWLPWKARLWLLGRPLFVEIPFGAAAYFMHWGTVTGMFAAAVAAIMAFAFMRGMRWLAGALKDGKYHPGVLTLKL